MEKGNSEEAIVLPGPAVCRRYSGPKPPSPAMIKRDDYYESSADILRIFTIVSSFH